MCFRVRAGPPIGLMDACEDEQDMDFEEIPGEAIAECAARWPQHVAGAIKALVKSRSECLCTERKLRRLPLPTALQRLQELANTPGGAEAAAEAEAATATATAAPSYTPSAPSALVRQLGKAAAGSGEALSLKQNATKAFNLLVGRLDGVYAARAAAAPADFKERIDFWRTSCGLPKEVHSGLHRLRVWRNASEHHDERRWRAEGPRDEREFTDLVGGLGRGIEALE